MPRAERVSVSEKAIARRVISARERRGLSAQDLATKLGFSRQAYHPYEHFDQAFTVSQLEKIAIILDTSLAYLLGIEEKRLGLDPVEGELIQAFRAVRDESYRRALVEQVKGAARELAAG
jgi:transcriptional regulator with XRE-family HTH domain